MSLADVISSLLGRRRPVPQPVVETRARSHHWITNPYHAVGVVPCLCACEAVRELTKRRYLAREAPPLPAKGCTERECTCRYKHFDDRRGAPRRASDKIAPPGVWTGAERRHSPGRRVSDGR
jgi:hypothetical protein